MKLLYLGDIVGRSGRDAVIERMPGLRRDLALDGVIACGENVSHGFGLTLKMAKELFACGIDVITLGNHAWDQREMIAAIDGEPRILRPLNYPLGTPGRGAIVFTTEAGRKVLVIQVMGRLFMDPLDDPFAAVAREIDKHRLGAAVDAIVVDVHAEASSEKMAMAHYCDGRVSMVVGSHTHIPTADAQVLPGGTAYQTDAGMCGDYDSVIGMKKEGAIARFVRKMPSDRLGPAEGEATVCGVIVTTHPTSGLATSVTPLRIGGRLQTCGMG